MNLFCTNHDINIICKDNVFTAFLPSSSMRPQPPLHCGLLPQTDLEMNWSSGVLAAPINVIIP